MAKKASLKRKAPLGANSSSSMETPSVSISKENELALQDEMNPKEQTEATTNEDMIEGETRSSEQQQDGKTNKDESGPDGTLSQNKAIEESDEEKWDLTHILTIQEINSTNPKKCMTKRCPLLACCQYVSSLDSSNVWFCCVDCQEKDYGGWPANGLELPVQFLSDEHRAMIVEKCSGRYAPEMPNIPTSLDHSSDEDGIDSRRPDVVDKHSDQHSDPTESGTNIEDEDLEQDSSIPSENINRISPIPMTADDNEPGPDTTTDQSEPILSQEEDDEDVEEKWDLTHILTAEEINATNPKKCMTKRCPLLACCQYVSSLDSSNVWFCCVDCQEKDYGGWPDRQELPVQFLSEEHRAMIVDKCSGRYAPEMPKIPTSLDATDPSDDDCLNEASVVEHPSSAHSHAITPPPNKISKSLDKKPVHLDDTLKKNTVTPNPGPTGPSKQALAIHQKWLETAKALGGEKLIVSKDAAKKVIFDLLHDSFRPMNITDIFNKLKGVVPSPVLKSCLDEMSGMNSKEQIFDDSDDDEVEEKKVYKSKVSAASTVSKNADAYTATICVKEGRNASATLYFVDQNKLFNNGDGMTPDSRNTLITKHEQAKAELENMNQQLNQAISQTTILLAQPTNVEADAKLNEIEGAVQKLTDELNLAESYRINEKRRKQINKSIEMMTTVWRTRKRLTLDFLAMMEETTEGSVSVKKSLSGDGPLEIDSDEAVLKAAKTFATKKRSHGSSVDTNRIQNMKKLKVSAGDIVSSSHDAFIGVMLDSRGMVKRVFEQD